MNEITPAEFVKKWGLTVSQFGSLMGLQSAQVYRLLAKDESPRKQPATIAQSDRFAELDLLLQVRSNMSLRQDAIEKMSRVVDAIEVMLKMMGLDAPKEIRLMVDTLRLDAAIVLDSAALKRINEILASEEKNK